MQTIIDVAVQTRTLRSATCTTHASPLKPPPASTDSFTKMISLYPCLLAIVCNLDHSKLALTLQLLSYSVLKYPPCGQTVVLSRFDLLPHSQRIHNIEKGLQQTGKLT